MSLHQEYDSPSGFLLARIAEDEAAGERAVVWTTPSGLAWIGPTPERATTLAISGDRLLAECEAKRWFVGFFDAMSQGPKEKQTAITALRLLALPYADRPDCQPEWKLT